MSETAREMLSDELVEAMEGLAMYPRLIAERAAIEAVIADHARLAEAVRGLEGHQISAARDGFYAVVSRVATRDADAWLDRADVLALLEPER